jgi:tRNA nucleotidyltransferase/poly(A) polymerase
MEEMAKYKTDDKGDIFINGIDKDIIYLIEKLKGIIDNSPFKGKVYLVGGCIRDMLLGKPIKDIDIVVEMPNGGTMFANYMTVKTRCFRVSTNPVIFDTYGTAKFNILSDERIKNIDLECVQTRKEQYHKDSRNPETCYGTIQEDAARRDLTINALYYNITTGKVSDFNGGKGFDDLNNRIIRTPSDPDIVFTDDPLRILRVIRFATRLGWGIEKNTWLGMIKNAHRINIISRERINDELSKILLTDKPSIGIRRLRDCGILHRILQDIYDEKYAYESKNPVVTTFDHTMDVLDEVQPILEHRLAALFHDVGKIVTDNDKTMSPNQFSSDVAEHDLKELKFPNDVIKSVCTAIKYHMFFSSYTDAFTPPDAKIRRFLNSTGDDDALTLDLMEANNLHVAFNKKKLQVFNILNRIEELEELDEIDRVKNVKLPIDGNDIIKEFNLKSSPKIGILLQVVKDAYFENPDITKDECFELVENKLKTMA